MAPRAPKRPSKRSAPKKPRRSRGFSDILPQSDFRTTQALVAIFAAYGNACAFTGKDLSKEAAADPRGYLLNLSADPGTSDPAVLIPATLDAIFAFEHGHIAIGPHYNIFADLERIAPEFAETLNAIGRIRLPADPAFHPSPAALTPHLIAFTAGRRPRD